MPPDKKNLFTSGMIKNGYREIVGAFRRVKEIPDIKNFLLAFFFYSAGVQTVIYLATIFAKKELRYTASDSFQKIYQQTFNIILSLFSQK